MKSSRDISHFFYRLLQLIIHVTSIMSVLMMVNLVSDVKILYGII